MDSCRAGLSGKSTRREAAICSGLHRTSRRCWTNSRSTPSQARRRRRCRRRLSRASRCARAGRYTPAGSVLRRSSRLTVDGLRPSSAAVARTVLPRSCSWAMTAPLVGGQEPWRQHHNRLGDHRRILADGACRGRDAAPEPPPCPRPTVDTHRPARLGVAHPLRDQPDEPRPLLRQRLHPRTTRTCHHDLQTRRLLRWSVESALTRPGCWARADRPGVGSREVAVSPGPGCDLHAVGEAELGLHVGQVRLDGAQ